MRLRALFERPSLRRDALRGYRRERIMELTLPVASAMTEGGFVGVIADKVYQVHPATLAVIVAAPMFGNLASFFFARLAVGRRKVPFIVALQTGMVALVALIALAPEGTGGAWLLVSSVVAARLLLAGIVTVRSMVWSLNYPRDVRARVTGRLTILAMLTVSVTSLVASLILDVEPNSFRTMYAIGAGMAAVGVIAFSRVPLIDEARQLSLERGDGASEEDGDEDIAEVAPGMWAVLRGDPLYARYLTWQFLAGVSNMMLEAPLVYLVSRELGAGYTTSIGITIVIPFSLSIATLPLWAVYLDRVHIARFRARQSALWVAYQLVLWTGALQASLPLLMLSRAILGLARGGGALAWQIGHNDFSPRRSLAAYMGVHVTLTGVRGAFAPFLGMVLYVGWSGATVPGLEWRVPGFEGIGAQTFLVACGLSTVSALGFVRLDRHIRRNADPGPGSRAV